MLSDTTGIRVFELAYQKAGGSLDGGFAEDVAETEIIWSSSFQAMFSFNM